MAARSSDFESPASQRRRLTGADWVAAAGEAIADGGVDAVAVEPLAAKLGTTKGSFYWHFRSRQQLLESALAAWEQEHTDAVITAMESLDRPAERLRELLRFALQESGDPIELALVRAAADPTVGPVVARVTQRRIDYVAALYRATGREPAAAYSQAVLAVSAFLGHIQLASMAPDTVPRGRSWSRHLAHIERALTPPDDSRTP